MITLNDIRVDGSSYLLSLTKLSGKKIVDIHGYLTQEFGDAVFKICHIIFDDGTKLGCEGEHDLPYITVYPKSNVPNMSDEILNRIYHEANRD